MNMPFEAVLRETCIVRTSCRCCHGVCQVLVHMDGEKIVRISGDPDSATILGFLCPKGAAAHEMLYHPDRLKFPMRRAGSRGQNRWKRISWDEAITEMTERFGRIRRESGPEFLAMAQGTGRPYTEFTIRFANAFGTPNFVNPGHLCYLPRVIASAITLGGLPVSDSTVPAAKALPAFSTGAATLLKRELPTVLSAYHGPWFLRREAIMCGGDLQVNEPEYPNRRKQFKRGVKNIADRSSMDK